jgi:RecJ-like exonuclease
MPSRNPFRSAIIDMATDNRTTTPDMAPGDQAPPGSENAGENLCPKCSGKGTVNGQSCEHCQGTGKVIEGVGGA